MDNSNQILITVEDLNTLKNIVDLASTRGAFRGAELAEVGAIYNKLSQFLDAVVAQAKQSAEKSTDTNQPQGE